MACKINHCTWSETYPSLPQHHIRKVEKCLLIFSAKKSNCVKNNRKRHNSFWAEVQQPISLQIHLSCPLLIEWNLLLQKGLLPEILTTDLLRLIHAMYKTTPNFDCNIHSCIGSKYMIRNNCVTRASLMKYHPSGTKQKQTNTNK